MLSVLTWIELHADLFTAVVAIISIVSIPVFLGGYFINLHKEQVRRDRETYEGLDEKYYAYLQLAAQYAELDVGEFPMASPPRLSAVDLNRQRAIFAILMSLFERAFLLYAVNQSSGTARREQWLGWATYIASFCQRGAFVDAWHAGQALYPLGASGARQSTFDQRFSAFLDEQIEAARTRAAVPQDGLPVAEENAAQAEISVP